MLWSASTAGVDAAAVGVAELPLTVLLVSVAVVALMPPPLDLAELPLTVLLVSVAVAAKMPPPSVRRSCR